jgi:hypothetical protein
MIYPSMPLDESFTQNLGNARQHLNSHSISFLHSFSKFEGNAIAFLNSDMAVGSVATSNQQFGG